MHQVLELAYVARPVIPIERRDALPRQAARRPAVARAEDVDEMTGEHARIAGAFAQRRQSKKQNLQPVVEVGPELPGEHHLPQADVGRGDDPDVRVLLALRTEGTVAEVLEEAQQRDLTSRTQRLDLVEEERPAVGECDQTGLRRARVGVRAAGVPEQLVLDQVLGKRSAIDRHERPILAAARIVDGARGHFLAGAGLAFDEDRRVGFRDMANQLDCFFEHR